MNAKLQRMPEGALEAITPWVELNDVISVLKPDDTLWLVIEKNRKAVQGREYSLVATFRLGVDGDWVVSADVQNGSADEVLSYLERRVE